MMWFAYYSIYLHICDWHMEVLYEVYQDSICLLLCLKNIALSLVICWRPNDVHLEKEQAFALIPLLFLAE